MRILNKIWIGFLALNSFKHFCKLLILAFMAVNSLNDLATLWRDVRRFKTPRLIEIIDAWHIVSFHVHGPDRFCCRYGYKIKVISREFIATPQTFVILQNHRPLFLHNLWCYNTYSNSLKNVNFATGHSGVKIGPARTHGNMLKDKRIKLGAWFEIKMFASHSSVRVCINSFYTEILLFNLPHWREF